MSTDPVSEPLRRTDDDVLARLAAIEHRLHQISTTIGRLLGQLDEIHANLETLSAFPGSGQPILAGAAGELPSCGERVVNPGRRLSLPRAPVEHHPSLALPAEDLVTSGPVSEEDPRYCPEGVRAALRWCAQPPAGDCGHHPGGPRR